MYQRYTANTVKLHNTNYCMYGKLMVLQVNNVRVVKDAVFLIRCTTLFGSEED